MALTDEKKVHEVATRAAGRPRTRDDDASQLISNIQEGLHVSLKGKACIDIGCRSGENTLAMQKAGAGVIGIDIDDSEFVAAREKGVKDEALLKASLQEYHAMFPDKKFDIATVFLWNIYRKK